jgi:hypothetical protein
MNKKIAKDNSAVKDDSNVNDVSRRNAIRGITLE